jgi:hypothetical protein
MDTIQIEITNHCIYSCANCTRFCPQLKKPFFMGWEQFKQAVDSMVGYPKMTGIMGGEPLLHPEFEKFCDYLVSKIPQAQLGLWTTLPKGFEKYREVICRTFKHIFVNDHSRADIYHQPPLVAVSEIIKDPGEMWLAINACWAQESWSASINPRGAWFCEIAAAMAMLFEEGEGWTVERGWWWKIPKDFASQMEQFCPRCGFAAPIGLRSSVEDVDDISPCNFELLKDRVRSPQRFKIHDLQPVRKDCNPPMAAYKDMNYRQRIAARYGMGLFINDQHFWSPYLSDGKVPAAVNIYEDYKERFGTCATS